MSTSPSLLEPPADATGAGSSGPSRGVGPGLREWLRAGASGPLLLFISAMLWGTNPPAMRYLFISEGPPSPAVISAVQSFAAALFMLLFSFALGRRASPAAGTMSESGIGAPPHLEKPTETAAAELPSRAAVQVLASTSRGPHAYAVETPLEPEGPLARFQRLARQALRATTDNIHLAGLELGLIGFCANCATVVGFEQTTASRGAFLIRLSVVFTALIAAASGERLAGIVWLGTALACGGGLLVSADRSPLAPDTGGLPTGGDLLIMLGAVLWALQTVRLGRHAPRFAAVRLASLQLLTMAALSAVWLAGDLLGALSHGLSAEVVWPGFREPLSWLVLLYPALGPWGIATALQVKAQNRVSPSQTQIIYATDPLWATLFAGLLGASEQHLGALGWIGAAGIVLATLVSSRGNLRGH